MSESLKTCKILITDELKRKLTVSNPTIPKLYCLPKIHKNGNGMRPIISCINSPTYLLSKWLVNKIQKFEPFPSFSVKNRYEFIDKIKDAVLEEDEYFVSFDVTSLYPNVPIPETMDIIKRWLESMNNISKEVIEEYIILINICMNQNTFQFKDLFYTQTSGTSMGNPLSCLVANIFMSNFEINAKRIMTYFPRVWIRYVDDVFAVFNEKENLDSFVNSLNAFHNTIKFTYEVENDNKLPFLDTLVIKKDKKIEFDIYRKPTHTNRYITNDSFHPPEQKRAAFHGMIYRLLNTPLSKENYQKELDYIKQTAVFNGYSSKLIENMLKKATKKRNKKLKTTLQPIAKENQEFISITHSKFSKNIKKTFKINSNKTITFKTKNKLYQQLGNPKSKTINLEKSGIYEIKCDCCDKAYVGQTKRNIKQRFKEHLSHIKYNRPEKSAIASHCLEENHTISKSNTKLLKGISDRKYLNAWETYFINLKQDKLVNNEDGPIQNSRLLHKNFISKLN